MRSPRRTARSALCQLAVALLLVHFSGRESMERTHELLFYMRDQGELSSIQTQISLSRAPPPVLTEFRANGYLLVICKHAHIFLSKMSTQYTRMRVDVREVYTLFLPTREAVLVYKHNLQDKGGHDASGDTENQ